MTSTFFGHAYSETVQAELYNCCETLGLGGLLQVSMDGPNANLNAHRLLDVQINGEVGHRLAKSGEQTIKGRNNDCAGSNVGLYNVD